MEVRETESSSFEISRRFFGLRSVQWRIDLGILPSSPSSSIDDLRRVTADSRRRYAALRRQFLVDTNVSKDGRNSPDLVMDNPLSQNPDSIWSRFFRSAELGRMVDQDLTRLYPEHDSYFQTSACQGILRRILLIWCLRHQDYGYGQGMHELLAPLLYVLHVDVEHLSEVRKTYEEYFTDRFDDFSFHDNDLTYKFDFKKFSDSEDDLNGSEKISVKATSPSELDPNMQSIILLSDEYGAEGELGVVLSEKFMEHDAYFMFDALMSGSGGAVAMADFFSPLPCSSSHTGFPPVIEASAALYHLLSKVDSSLYSHLIELQVEPQYFSLRWLRVLFGREFSLEDLLIIWDEIFAQENSKFDKSMEVNKDSCSGILDSWRGAYISAFAVSMILYLRSTLLATENATSCLQRLLNLPNDVNLEILIKKAKSLQALAVDANSLNPLLIHAELFDRNMSTVARGHSFSMESSSPKTPLNLVPESYWEEKWKVLHVEEERKQGALEKQIQNPGRSWSEKVKSHLSRTASAKLNLYRAASAPSSSEIADRNKEPKLSERRNLLEDLAQQLGLDEDVEKMVHAEQLNEKGPEEGNGRDRYDEKHGCLSPQICMITNASSEETSEIFSDLANPVIEGAEGSQNESGSSVTSDLSTDENYGATDAADLCRTDGVSFLPVSDLPNKCTESGQKDNSEASSAIGLKEQKLLSSKFRWFWKFGKVSGGTSETGLKTEANLACIEGANYRNSPESSIANGGKMSAEICKEEILDQNVMVTLRNLGHSMLENIQVIETVFQHDRTQAGRPSKNALVGKGQVTAMAALKELRKISNLLSEM